MIGIILIGYAAFKTNVLLSRSSVNVVSSIKDNFIKADERFGAAQGFAVAAAWSSNETADFELKPSIGEIVFVVKEWGITEEGKFFLESKELPSHKCSL